MRRLYLLLSVLLVWHHVPAQTGSRSLLWEISGKGLPAPSYVLGTIHMLCPEDLLWSAAMDSALGKARSVCMELDMDDPQTLQKMMQGFKGPDTGKSLKEILAPADYQRFAKFANDSAGIDPTALEEIDPGMLPLMFLGKLLPCSMPASYEARIAMQAATAKKPLEGLESVDEQLSLLQMLDTDTSGSEIMKLVDSFAFMKQQFRQLVAIFRQQNLDSLAGMIESSPMLGGQTDALLRDRNRRWIPRMEGYMRKGSVFFAVGAGHLPGKDGVLQLLRNAGYRVRPLR